MWDFLLALICSFFGGCSDSACRQTSFANSKHIVCSYDVSKIDVRLFLRDESDSPYGNLDGLKTTLNRPTLLLMNGGMYHDDLDAVGLYISDGKELKPISTKGGWGNFHLLPNGVFYGKGGKLGVLDTQSFIRQKIKPDFATQSGPMLVINGKLHPRFLKDSDSFKIRNGVGISRDGKRLHFAISRSAVTFWDFGELFQKELKAHNALFLDGTVSAIRAEGFSQGGWRALGPIIGVFDKKTKEK